MSFGPGVNIQTRLALARLGRNRPRWIGREDCNLEAELGRALSRPLARAAALAGLGTVYRCADAFVAVSHGLAGYLRDHARLAPERLHAIHNPIDLRAITNGLRGGAPPDLGRPFLVAAGRLVWQKGFDVLLSAFAASRAASRFDLVILGEGPLEADLRRQAAALGIAERVRFAGFQSNPWIWFAHAALFVSPSRWEGFGNVIAEAMACGAPALVTDCGFGPREQLTHGESGWIAPEGDPAALAGALDHLLARPALRARLAEAGRRRAQAFDADRIARIYDTLFLREAAAARAG
jgi:glycosyltransferase involved in cell wall biosynthesis